MLLFQAVFLLLHPLLEGVPHGTLPPAGNGDAGPAAHAQLPGRKQVRLGQIDHIGAVLSLIHILGDILHFDPDTARRNVELGYYDTLRAFGRVRGCAYAVDNGPDSSADAAAFRARFDAVQKAVREKYPVTLTADAALLLARMKDAELAPLETVAEDVGVDPTVYYTTRTLGQAFLEHCDPARMAGFAPLFAGSADAGRAALAALLPNTFLQALVWQALTAPELPEVTEHEDL